jgi:hypothetical protein
MMNISFFVAQAKGFEVGKLVSSVDGAEIMDDDDIMQIAREEKFFMVLGPGEMWQQQNSSVVSLPTPIATPEPTVVVPNVSFEYRLPEFSVHLRETLRKEEDAGPFVKELIETIVADMRKKTNKVSYVAARNVVDLLKLKYPKSFEGKKTEQLDNNKK